MLRHNTSIIIVIVSDLLLLIQFNYVLQLDNLARFVQYSVNLVFDFRVCLDQYLPKNDAVLDHIRTIIVLRIDEWPVQQRMVHAETFNLMMNLLGYFKNDIVIAFRANV